MSDVPAKYETTYYEVIHRGLSSAQGLVDLAIQEKWPRAEMERIRDKLDDLFHELTDHMSDRETP